MAKLELERGTDVLLLETGDALLFEASAITIDIPLATVDSEALAPSVVTHRAFPVAKRDWNPPRASYDKRAELAKSDAHIWGEEQARRIYFPD